MPLHLLFFVLCLCCHSIFPLRNTLKKKNTITSVPLSSGIKHEAEVLVARLSLRDKEIQNASIGSVFFCGPVFLGFVFH